VASLRFAIYYVLGYLGGLFAGPGSVRGLDVVVGTGFWIAFSLATEVTNRWADRIEDAVNRPVRTDLCTRIGFDRLRLIALGLWTLLVLVAVVWATSFPAGSRWTFGLVYLVAIAAGVNYSVGIRLKVRRFGALVVLAFPIAATIYCGVLAQAARTDPDFSLFGFDGAAEIYALGVALTLLLGALASLKDITDVVGDSLIGYRSAVTMLTGRTSVAVGVLAIAGVALLGFVVGGYLTPRYLLLGLFIISGFGLARLASSAGGDGEAMLVRELHYLHWLGVLGVAVVLLTRSTLVAGLWAVGAVLWLVFSRYLHWTAILFDGPQWARLLQRLAR